VQSRAVAYCRRPASTVTPGIEPRWDPWPYICSMSRLCSPPSFVVPPLIKREGLDFFYNWCSLTTPFSTRGHIKVEDIYILYMCRAEQSRAVAYSRQPASTVTPGIEPTGTHGGVEYLHRDPASRKRRRKGKSQI
jgi:hypothetical protein